MSEECSLCRLAQGLDRVTNVVWEDNVCVAVYCKSHPDKILLTLKRHTDDPEMWEKNHMISVICQLNPKAEKRWRLGRTMTDHFHVHEDVVGEQIREIPRYDLETLKKYQQLGVM